MADLENRSTGRLGISKNGKAKGPNGKKAPLTSRANNDHEDQTVEQRYQKKTQLEHILLRPDTYIGSTEKVTQDMWVYHEVADSIVKRPVTFVPGLYKIFDEIIVNAADNKQRDPNMSKLKVTIDAENGSISVWNDGKGIPIQMHREHDMYVPELIFGNLLTGSNFDDNQKKTTGGRNGFGAKLANIYSTEFVVETADERAGKHYRQVFRNNMQEKGEPVIDESYDGCDFTCITFKPDWKRFHMSGMEEDTIAILRKRVYDMAGCMAGYGGARMKVYLDQKRLQCSSFKEYMSMYEGMESPVIFEKINDRWEVGVAVSSDGVFQQVSYVNSICTVKGGTHVECIANQVIAKLLPVLKRKNKSEVKGHFVKNHLCVFVNGLVENPAFNSQSKEALTSKDSSFGSMPSISDSGLKTIEKSEIVERVLSWAKHKQNQQLNKKSGKKSSKLTGITKLDDANLAGTAKSQDCTLILTEGDSAKTLAVSGLGVVGRDRYGVFPLKGKLLNVREATNPQVLKNEEIQNVVKILGLKFNHKYEDTKSLRYGHLMIMTDQDHDGSHIKGLLINFVHHYWPSLLKIDGFLQEFITPIVKVSRGRNELSFYTVPEYEVWKETHANGKGWNAKYYKGLGTSTAKEAKEYFAALDTHQLEFEWKDDHKDADLIDMAFSKKRVEDRKDWLRAFKVGTHADYNVESVTYESFINKELILFSMEDNKRSIPCLADGFKPSQRKVLYSCFKRNLKKEIKVAQLAGYVSEHSAYHHGEASLNGTIIAMAQNFTGSNNLNLLCPGGQFGTRLLGGKDAASPRYIFTCLEKAARAVFHPDDDALLTFLEDDGLSIEPDFYLPVLPLILVNGSDGIGTGWSSSVPNYSPRDIIENLRRRLQGQSWVQMQPWYNGFAGIIEPKASKKGVEGSFSCRGIVERMDDTTVEITELPVRKWTQEYKQFLESLLSGAEDPKGDKAKAKGGGAKGDKAKDKASSMHIKDFKENHTDTTVHFTVTMSVEDLDAIDKGEGLYKFFKLEATLNTTNMVLFDTAGQLIRYDSPQHIMEEFFTLRLDFYHRRKAALLDKMQNEWRKLDNKVRFILAVVEGRLQVNNRKKADLLDELHREGYDLFLPSTGKPRVAGGDGEGDSEEGDDGEADKNDDQLAKGYDYLLGMKLWSLTLERVRLLENELEAKTEEMAILRGTSPSDIWLRDLDALGDVLDDIAEVTRKQDIEDDKQRKNAAKRKVGGRAKGRGKAGHVDLDDDDSDFNDGPSKKAKSKSKASSAPPPPPPRRAMVPELVFSAAGGKVSAAFAEAEANGSVVTVEDLSASGSPAVGKRDSTLSSASSSGSKNKAGYGIVDIVDDQGRDDAEGSDEDLDVPTKKMSNLSLEARLKSRRNGTTSAASQSKPQRATQKVSSYAVEDSDGHDSDSDVAVVSKPLKPATAGAKGRGKAAAAKPKATANLQKMELGSDDDGIFDSDEDVSGKQATRLEEESDGDEFIVAPPRPARTARGKGVANNIAKANANPRGKGMSKTAAKTAKTKDDGGGGGDDIFAIDDSDNDRGIVPKAKATAKGKANAAITKGKGRVNTKKSPPKPKGLKRGSRMSVSDEEVFSPDKLSPDPKRLSNQATPAQSRLLASRAIGAGSADGEDSDIEVQEVTKTPRPVRRGGRATKVVYAEMDSDEEEEEDGEEFLDDDADDDDDESEFEG